MAAMDMRERTSWFVLAVFPCALLGLRHLCNEAKDSPEVSDREGIPAEGNKYTWFHVFMAWWCQGPQVTRASFKVGLPNKNHV